MRIFFTNKKLQAVNETMSRKFPCNHTQNNHFFSSQFIQQIGQGDKVNTNSQVDPTFLVGGLDS